MNYRYLISKYDEEKRSGDVDDWTSYNDIGKTFQGHRLTAEEYYRTEDLYISFLSSLAVSTGVEAFELRDLILNEPVRPWLSPLFEGRVIGKETAFLLARRMLRNGLISCTFVLDGFASISVGTDYYLVLDVPSLRDDLIEVAERLGLHATRFQFCVENDGETLFPNRPADGGFWQDVINHANVVGCPAVVQEWWAEGKYGQSWYLIDCWEAAQSAMAAVKSQSLLSAFFGVKVYWSPRVDTIRFIESELPEDSAVVVFSRPLGESRLESLTCLEGASLLNINHVPAGGELGFFSYPDDANLPEPPMRAVVPDETGTVCAQ